MAKSKLPNSLRKFLRREKARLRRENLDPAEAEKKIQELVVRMRKQYSKREFNRSRDKRQGSTPDKRQVGV